MPKTFQMSQSFAIHEVGKALVATSDAPGQGTPGAEAPPGARGACLHGATWQVRPLTDLCARDAKRDITTGTSAPYMARGCFCTWFSLSVWRWAISSVEWASSCAPLIGKRSCEEGLTCQKDPVG